MIHSLSILVLLFVSAVVVPSSYSFSLTRRRRSPRDVSYPWQPTYVKFEEHPEPEIVVEEGSNKVLQCRGTGGPTPTIHWLFNNVRIASPSDRVIDDEANAEALANTKPAIRLQKVVSKLYIDCAKPRHSGQYTCVLETPKQRIVKNTIVTVSNAGSGEGKCNTKKLGGPNAQPPRITMWASIRIEYEYRTVQLFCRAEGHNMKMTWLDRNRDTITNNQKGFKILKNGDLIIKDITHADHLGNYKCIVENEFGSDSAETYLFIFAEG